MNAANQPIAVVTGASSGLGKAMARRFRDAGFFVVALSRREPDPGVADRFLPCDLSQSDAVEKTAALLLADYPEIAVLINNAGLGAYAAWENLSMTDLRYEFEVDFFAPVALTKKLLPALLAAQGSVINLSSMAAFVPVACMGAYNAVKAAMRMFSWSLTMETQGRGLHILNVCPGRIDTGFSSRAVGGVKVPDTPGRRSSSPEALADKVFRAYRKRRRELIYPRWYALGSWFFRRFPSWTIRLNRRLWYLGKEA